MHLGKYHGLGNDFLIALAAQNQDLSVDPGTAAALCDRKRGIGADGLIYVLTPSDAANDAQMVLLNADGSRAEISGNGIRCMAQALMRERLSNSQDDRVAAPGSASPPQVLRIQSDSGVRDVTFAGGDPRDRAWFVVDMGVISDGPALAGASLGWAAQNIGTVDIGNPHLVLEVEDPSEVDLAVAGPTLEAAYPGGMNVHFVSAVDRSHLDLFVWERGVGITDACGSGAAAAVAVAERWGIVDAENAPVKVTMPGGQASVELRDGHLLLSGPSQYVGEVFTP